jgi:hypothetical protein
MAIGSTAGEVWRHESRRPMVRSGGRDGTAATGRIGAVVHERLPQTMRFYCTQAAEDDSAPPDRQRRLLLLNTLPPLLIGNIYENLSFRVGPGL